MADQDDSVPEDQKPSEDVKETVETKEDPKKDNNNKADKGSNKFKQLWAKYLNHKKITIPATVVVLLALLLGIPYTRFQILGLFIKRDFNVAIVDSQNNSPVSGVDLSLKGISAKTDGNGKATLHKVKPGPGTLSASKKYYQDTSQKVSVPLGSTSAVTQLKLVATGRQVPITVINKISGAPISGVTVKAADTQVQTDKNGQAKLVLPADKTTVSADISLDGFNPTKADIKVTDQVVKDNTLSLTPAGKVYFLSKRTGKINVMKSDLDGQNAAVVLAAQGTEEDGNTVLLASRDWQRLALLSRRGTTTAHLYLIDTTDSDKLTEIDGGDNAQVSMTGWTGHYFVYQVTRSNVQNWQPNKTALKSYNSDNKQLTTADQTSGEGTSDSDYAAEIFGNTFLLNDQIVYSKYWYGVYGSSHMSGKRMGIYKVGSGGAGRTLLKDFDNGVSGYISATLNKPQQIYFSINSGGTTFYEYNGTNLSVASDISSDSFNQPYPTYLQSPSGNKTFWYESRDGKNSLFVGDGNGAGGKEIARLSDYVTYGWFTEDYLLVSKGGSELFIMPVAGAGTDNHVIKITDYHKPDASFYGYGGGYGGI